MTHDEIAAFVARWDAARARPVDVERIVLEEIERPRVPACPGCNDPACPGHSAPLSPDCSCLLWPCRHALEGAALRLGDVTLTADDLEPGPCPCDWCSAIVTSREGRP